MYVMYVLFLFTDLREYDVGMLCVYVMCARYVSVYCIGASYVWMYVCYVSTLCMCVCYYEVSMYVT